MIEESGAMPAPFDAKVYRSLWPDLDHMNDDGLLRHFERFGVNEGRRANSLETRLDFAALVPADKDALEIGPYYNPLLSGSRVKYFDVLSQDQMRARALASTKDPAGIPFIDYVSPTGDLGVIEASFDNVLSSHCVEHQPDLISHFRQVTRLLNPQGRYFLLVPDKRYCFDSLLRESTVADILDAHERGVRTHSLKSVIEHRAFTTHNHAVRHWNGDHGAPVGRPERIKAAVDEFKAACGGYVDVHAWCFTPDSASTIISTLFGLHYVDLFVERLYHTRRNGNEFWMILKKADDRMETTKI